MAKALEDYDPESEVLVVVIAPDGVAHCYCRRMHDELLPPNAYEAWRRENPIGLRLNPERSPGRHLKDLAGIAREQERTRRSDRSKILSDPERQAGFLRSLIDLQQQLSDEISAKDYKVGGSEGILYEPTECTGPGTAWDRLQEYALLVDYMVATTALNQVLLEYEGRKGEGWLGKAARAGLDALGDKYLITLASLTTLNCEEEMREYFTYMTAALLSTRIDLSRSPRLRAALACDGGDPREELLLRLGHCIPLAWEKYARKAHVSSENDSNIFVRLVVEELEHDEPEEYHQARIRAQQLRRESARKVKRRETPDSPLRRQSLAGLRASIQVPASQSEHHFDNATAPIATKVFEDQLARHESMIDIRNLVNKSHLTEREAEVLRHQLQGESNVEIARMMGTAASTIGTHISSITKKLRMAKDRSQKAPAASKERNHRNALKTEPFDQA